MTLSFQLYSARFEPSMTDFLKTLAELGYTSVEGFPGVCEDPNFFGGELRLTDKAVAAELPAWDHPLSKPNQGARANYRGIALADMARAISEGRAHRCDHRLARHAVEVMTKILEAGETGGAIEMNTTCDRPAPLSPEEAQSYLKG